MFGDYVFEKSSAQYADNILLLDDEDLNSRANYISAFSAHGFEIVRYTDDLAFRIEYEEKLKTPGVKLAVLARSSQYIPYDVRRRLNAYMVALESLFPKLHPELLKDKGKADLDLLCAAYKTNFDDFRQKRDTETYLRMKVYSRANVKAYLKRSLDALLEKAGNIKKYSDWFALAEEKAQLDVMAVQYEIDLDTQEINRLFQEYALAHFGKLSQNIDKSSPVLVSKAMDYMSVHSEKFIIVVMDGMSEFDWKIISTAFKEVAYEKSSMFAMIPSTTSVSRQCLLSGKYPSQLLEPWKQSKEKTEFVDCARTLGYTDSQIGYERGYDAQFGSFVRCGAVIINDVDDMVHAQIQGRLGMFNDITVLANQKKLLKMTKRFMATGYDVYITADHGNTPCTGLGKLMGTGVEVETKSRRTLALKDFADKAGLIEKHGLVEYPKYYLPKEYDYLICDVGDSFDAKGDEVMTHGGITLDEVVVPFIKIKAVQKNG
ncbi:PglZ domain-containing protein [uncultured Bacteroides sp.]|uniref:PglZ domain-containing protein n=1 Tax=uncultured Bacteroides sp. TaxID=162156 RepID=UPI00259B4B7A|nr:PglZ domain-containing protein [uncultured Bacteroides sp.]